MSDHPDSTVFGITVRYGLNVRPPIIQQRVVGSASARRFLDDMEWDKVIRVEITVLSSDE